MQTFITVVLLISCLGVIISTLLMEPKSEGMGSLSGSSSNAFGKTASRGKEQMLNMATIISGAVFAISTIILTAIS